MNNRFGYYHTIDGHLYCFATEEEYLEYISDENKD